MLTRLLRDLHAAHATVILCRRLADDLDIVPAFFLELKADQRCTWVDGCQHSNGAVVNSYIRVVSASHW